MSLAACTPMLTWTWAGRTIGGAFSGTGGEAGGGKRAMLSIKREPEPENPSTPPGTPGPGSTSTGDSIVVSGPVVWIPTGIAAGAVSTINRCFAGFVSSGALEPVGIGASLTGVGTATKNRAFGSHSI